MSDCCPLGYLFFLTVHVIYGLKVFCFIIDDDSRVILEPDGNEKTDFINASYIHVSLSSLIPYL